MSSAERILVGSLGCSLLALELTLGPGANWREQLLPRMYPQTRGAQHRRGEAKVLAEAVRDRL